jgi:hypothetical protein
MVNLSTRFLSLLRGGMVGGVYLALALFSVSGGVVYGTFCLVFIKMAGVTARDVIHSFVRIFAFSVPGLCVLIFIKLIAVSPLSVFVISCVLIALYYAVIRGLLSHPHA